MAKTDALQGSLDLLVLKLLSRRPRLHGYAIMAAIASTSGEVLRADSGRRARLYELTAAGRKQLGVEESRWHSVSMAINRVLREA